MKQFPNLPKKAVVILFWLLLWQLLATAVHNQILLVGPLDALRALSALIGTPEFWNSIQFSFFRICLGFLLAFFTGLATGTLSYKIPVIDEFLAPPIHLMKSIPIASFVILALIWTGSENLSVFISFMVVCPVIHVNTLAGLHSADLKLLEMAHVFRVPVWRQILYIYRAALYPYLSSALKTALGMGFKSGIAAEVIGVPDGSIGAGLYTAKIYLSTADLFAWTFVIIVISMLFEKAFLFLLKKAAGKGAANYDRNERSDR